MNQKSRRPFPSAGKVSRLTFTDEECSDPELEKPLKKARDKLEWAQGKIPKKKSLATERTFDAKTGKAKVRLYFEEIDKPKPPSKLSHAVKTIPQRELLNKIHKEIREGEQDNVGVEAAHKSEEGVEFVARRIQGANHSHKLRPYRRFLKAEEKTKKAELNYLYKKSPKSTTNPISKWQQKQAIKKEYLAARYGKGTKNTQNTGRNIKKAANNVAQATKKTGQYIVRHWKGILILIALSAVLLILLWSVSSLSVMFESGINSFIGTSYTSEDEDIVAVDNGYIEFERQLQGQINNIEQDYPGYDEYQYHLDEIGHNPFTLASYLTAKLQVYTRANVQAELRALFDEQYTLTTQKEIEVRYRTETRTRTWTDDEGNTHTETYTVEVPYDYYILHVTLKNKDISILASNNLTDEQYEMFGVYMETQGNKDYLFEGNIYAPSKGEYTDYDIPPDALTDPDFAALIQEAEKYLGYPYVWGGSSPSTSFDCSGFVCWVLRQSGVYNIGRTTAQGIFNQCAIIPPSEARPGDIIFFTGTYASSGAVSHVGIYVGNGMMIHCGNPIQYASVNTAYWTEHFYAYGRLN